MMSGAARLALAWLGGALAWLAARALLPSGAMLPAGVLLAADATVFLAGAAVLYLALRRRDTAREQLAGKLRIADERLRLVTEIYADWYWEIDAELRFTHAQGGGLARFGLDPASQLIGKTSRELEGFRLMDMDSADFARMRAERRPYRDVRASLELADGTLRYVAITGEPRFAADGRFEGYRGFTREITAQVEAEFALQASERRFRRIVETAPNLLFFITNPARDNWIYRSPNWGAIWNYSGALPQKGRLTTVLDRILPEDRPLYHGRAEAEARGEVVDIEFRFRDPDRGIRWLRTRTVGVPVGDGEVEVYGVTEDVTERHRALEQISASEALHRSVLEVMAEGVIIRDATGKVTAANAAAERILGLTPDSLVGATHFEPVSQSVREDGRPFAPEDFPAARVMRSGQPVLGVVMGTQRPDGTQIWMRVNSVPLGAFSGSGWGVVTTFQDITLERAATAELSGLAASLERRVAERTEALLKTNRELEDFAHSVSHDLRAPLRAINGFARLLAEREGARLDGESRRLLSRIEAGAGRMGELIDDVIEYSGATRREPDIVPVDMDRVAEKVVARLANAYPGTRLEVGRLGTVRADTRMVERILEALVGNALKFSSRAARPHVRVWAESGADAIEVHVADNGTGFDMAHAGHLFALFRRLHHDHEFPGTGVGLATVKNLVERLGGTVSARSAPGEGATFTVRLPRAAA